MTPVNVFAPSPLCPDHLVIFVCFPLTPSEEVICPANSLKICDKIVSPCIHADVSVSTQQQKGG